MKKLKQFLQFNSNDFLKDKTLEYLSGKATASEDSTKGVKVDLVIVKDNTKYDAPNITNLYEHISVKIENVDETYLNNFHTGQKVRITDIQKATVWGEYGQNLSFVAKLQHAEQK